jgi:sialic acid synthase SpsE
MARFKIGPRWIGSSEPLYVVAEAGVNHENSLATAKRMIQKAAQAKADAIKFQSYKARSLASRYSPAYWDRNKEPADSQYELFSRYDHFGPDDYRELATCAAENNISFLTTAFDEEFVDELEDILPAFKVASADITYHPLLKKIASKQKPVILSVGAATVEEIREAITLLKTHGCPHIALLHCVLNYPCPPEFANLRAITALQRTFPEVVVGYSDHVPARFNLLQLSMAWVLGARIVEKHFTLDKTKPGNDHYHAMDPEDLRLFRQQQAYLEDLLGSGTIGNSANEEIARRFARRSLVASRRIVAGQRATREMIAVKRPGTGIPPQGMEDLMGKRASRNIEEDTILQWEMFEI